MLLDAVLMLLEVSQVCHHFVLEDVGGDCNFAQDSVLNTAALVLMPVFIPLSYVGFLHMILIKITVDVSLRFHKVVPYCTKCVACYVH